MRSGLGDELGGPFVLRTGSAFFMALKHPDISRTGFRLSVLSVIPSVDSLLEAFNTEGTEGFGRAPTFMAAKDLGICQVKQIWGFSFHSVQDRLRLLGMTFAAHAL